MTIRYEFPSDEGDIGPFVSNEILWLNLVFLLFVFDVGMNYSIRMLCNRCIIL